MIVEAKQEETVFVDGMPLRVDFSPEAIRQHFDKRRVDQLTDEQLLQVGQAALWSDDLWACFHEILCQAVEEELGFSPEDPDDLDPEPADQDGEITAP